VLDLAHRILAALVEPHGFQFEFPRVAPLCLGIGLFQCLSLIPGVSRSGATIVGALILGGDKRSAAEFSFFLAMPTMLGAFVMSWYLLRWSSATLRRAEKKNSGPTQKATITTRRSNR